MWPCSSVIIKALSGISHTNICTLTIALYKRTNSRHHSTPDIVNKCTKRHHFTGLCFFCSKGRANYFTWPFDAAHTRSPDKSNGGRFMVESTEKDKKVETRNLTQGIYILLFNYLVVDLIWVYWECAIKAALCNTGTQRRIGRVRGEEKLMCDCGRSDRNSTMKWRKNVQMWYF